MRTATSSAACSGCARSVDHEADTRRLDEVSPLLDAARIVAPVLLAHGDKDQRVPIVHSEKMLEALRGRGKKSSGSSCAGERHGIAHPENRERFYDALFNFLGEEHGAGRRRRAVDDDPAGLLPAGPGR